MPKRGRDFEDAVWQFAKTLGPTSEVLFDHKVPDRDTGEPRQCDVWVNTTFGGHWPMSILVSCKDHKRKLHQGDIGTFYDEIRSTGATTGVIYSRGGYYEPAIRKAKALGITCCRLYQNEPVDIPVSFWFEEFACDPTIQIRLSRNDTGKSFQYWNEVFEMELPNNKNVLQSIVNGFRELELQAVDSAKERFQLPKDTLGVVEVKIDEQPTPILLIDIALKWRKFRSKIEATLIDGSYCLSNGSFIGHISGPTLAIREAHPGKNWIEILDDKYPFPAQKRFWIRYKGDVESALRERVGPEPIG